MQERELTDLIIGCAIKVHKVLGPGLLEAVYVECLNYELKKNGLYTELQKPLPLIYEEVKLECGYRADLVVERRIIIEAKAVEALNQIHFTQVLTYLKLSRCNVGLLINFNVLRLKDGLRRFVMN